MESRLPKRGGPPWLTSPSGRSPLVVLEHPTEPLSTDDLLRLGRRVIDVRPDSEQGLVLLTLVWPKLLVVAQVLGHKVVEVPEPERDESIQALVLD